MKEKWNEALAEKFQWFNDKIIKLSIRLAKSTIYNEREKKYTNNFIRNLDLHLYTFYHNIIYDIPWFNKILISDGEKMVSLEYNVA